MAVRAPGVGIGSRGAAGRGIASAVVDPSGRLIVTYTDGTTADVGAVSGMAGRSVYTGSGAPAASNGATGDLYIDAQSGDLYRKDA